MNTRAQEAWPLHRDPEPDGSSTTTTDPRAAVTHLISGNSAAPRTHSLRGPTTDLLSQLLNQLNTSDASDASSQSPAERTSDPHSGSSMPLLCSDTTVDPPGPATPHTISSRGSNEDGRLVAEFSDTGQSFKSSRFISQHKLQGKTWPELTDIVPPCSADGC